MIRKCKQCGKRINTGGGRKFCGRVCYGEYRQHAAMLNYHGYGKKKTGDTICWECRNANDSCPWHSEKHLPFPGWKATPTTVKMSIHGDKTRCENSYVVHECPGFKREDRRDISMLWKAFVKK